MIEIKNYSTNLFALSSLRTSILYVLLILFTCTVTANENINIQDENQVTGKVTRADNEPLQGATIYNVEKGEGTVTDVDGNFILSNVSVNSTLRFSFIGTVSQEIIYNGNGNISIQLLDDVVNFEELVVTALGIKREEKALGYAVQSVGGESLSTVKTRELGTSLSGKVAGLMVKNSTEFGDAPEVLIRGEAPLLVVDGIPYGNMTLSDIPADDVEDISILKGATASALYGSRGESGAIMVTTKRGLSQKGLSVSFNSSTMFTAGYVATPEMQTMYGRTVSSSTNIYNQKAKGSWGVPLDGREVIQWNPETKQLEAMPYVASGANNFENYCEQGYVLNNNVSIAHQGENGSIRASSSWVENKGQYPNSNYSKIAYSLAGDIDINGVKLTSSMTYNKHSSPNIGFGGYKGYDPMYSLLVWGSPDYDIRDYEDYWLVENEVQNSSYTSGANNPYFDRYERTHSIDKDILNGFLSANYEITDWLNAAARFGYDTYSNKQTVKISQGSYTGAGTSTVISGGKEIWGESKNGSYNTGIGRGYSYNGDFILTANKKFKDFGVNGFIGGTLYGKEDEGLEARTKGGLSIPGFYSLLSSVDQAEVYSNTSKIRTNSIYGQVAASWKSLLFAEATLRNDWTSTLPESTRSYLYPSVSGSFVASELLPENDYLSFWKIRGSWTESKRPAGIYSTNQVYSIDPAAWDDNASAYLPTTIRGAEVAPQTSATFEVGTMMNFFKNRASIDIAYYSKRTYDYLKSAAVSPASGYSYNYTNTDEEQTRRGIELAAKVTPVSTNNWKWNINVNFTKYARYYTQLDEEFSSDNPWVKVGERVDHFTIQQFLRDPEGNIINSNGKPVKSSYYSLYGYSDPDAIWGLSTSLRYKNVSLNIAADGRIGGMAQSSTEAYMWNSGNHPESVKEEARYLDATDPGSKNYIAEGVMVTGGDVEFDSYGNIVSDTREYAPNDVAVTYETYIKAYHKGTAWGGSPTEPDVFDATFFKIREVSLTYDLPKSLLAQTFIKNGSVSLIGQNVLYWAKDFKYSDIDGGTENFSDPSPRYLGFNVKFDF